MSAVAREIDAIDAHGLDRILAAKATLADGIDDFADKMEEADARPDVVKDLRDAAGSVRRRDCPCSCQKPLYGAFDSLCAANQEMANLDVDLRTDLDNLGAAIADDLYSSGRIAGLLCLGYPCHPLGKPDQLRTEHLKSLKTPTLIAQGTRDLFGTREEVSTYQLSKNIEILWLEDGNHDLKPRKSLSGFSAADHLRTLAEAVSAWAQRIVGLSRP